MKNAKIIDKDKTNSYFLTLWAMVVWFSAEIIFALFNDKLGISKDDLLGAACISFIVIYAVVKPMISRIQLKLWMRYVLYFISYTFLFFLISFM